MKSTLRMAAWCLKARVRGTASACASSAPNKWASLGRSYREILAYYYPGTAWDSPAADLSWQRLGGELDFTADDPAGAGSRRAGIGGASGEALTATYKWPVPTNIEIRVYPDLDTFRNATGEPGWVAAHTEGRRIHLQPVAVLRQQGRSRIDAVARTDARVCWNRRPASGFRLVSRRTGQLSGKRTRGRRRAHSFGPRFAPDRRPGPGPPRLCRRDRLGRESCAALWRRRCLDWVKRGVPAEVTKASTNQATTKSK